MKTFKNLTILLAVLLISINCSRDDVVSNEISNKDLNFTATTFLSNEILDITKSFSKRMEDKRNAQGAKLEQQMFWVDEESAIGIKDSIGNMTYSFRMYVQNSDPNSVYNLVVNRRVDGNNSPDFVMKYEFINQNISDYSQMEEKKFNGKIDAYSFESFLTSLGQTSKSAEPEPCYNDLAPAPTPINNNSSTSSGAYGSYGGSYSGTGPASGYGSSGTSVSGSGSWATAGSSSLGSSFGSTSNRKATVEGGHGCFCGPLPDEKIQKGISSKTEDCPKGEMIIAVNTKVKLELLDELSNPCVKQILVKLQQKDLQKLTVPDIGNLAGTSHLSQGILDLFDKSGNYNLTFKVEQLGTSGGNEINGQTISINGGWQISLDSDLVNKGTRLFIAKTIIHESTHAFLKYILKTNRTSDLVSDLNEIYKIKNDENLTHHQFISQYIDGLAHSLSVWDNNSQSLEYYKKISWGGLETSEAYKQLKNKSDIQQAIQNERYGKPAAKGALCN